MHPYRLSLALVVGLFGVVGVLALPAPEYARPAPLVAPFDAKDAASGQRLWARHLGVDTRMELDLGKGVTLPLVLVPPGTFTMGTPEGQPGRSGDEIEHPVTLSQPFWLGKTEVTRGQFRRFVDETGFQTTAEKSGKGASGCVAGNWVQKPEYTWKTPGFDQTDHHPIVCLSWEDAVAFCDWLGTKTRRKVTLPTEARWEYACRAGTTTTFYHGEDSETLPEFANCPDASAARFFASWTTTAADDGHTYTAPVGRFRANAFGLHDMLGNAWEWCADVYGEYPRQPVSDPTGPEAKAGVSRCFRGGSWFYTWQGCRSGQRISFHQASANAHSSLRVCVEIGQ